jgi:Flp pilus assembly pilin Flp
MKKLQIKRPPGRSRMAPSGQTMTEYAIIVSTVAVVALAGYHQLTSFLVSLLNSIIGGL